MNRLICWICSGWLLLVGGLHAEDVVSIERGKSMAVIRSGEEILATYRFGSDLPKPYLIAVSAPGAIDVLVSDANSPPENAFDPGNRVFVAVEAAEVRSINDRPSDQVLEFGTILEIGQVEGAWLGTADGRQWVRRGDVVPLRGMVTRIVDLAPTETGDRNQPHYYDHPHHKGVWLSIDEVNGIKFWKEDGRIANRGVEVLVNDSNPAVLRIKNDWLGPDGGVVLTESTTLRVFANRLFVYDITFTAGQHPVRFDDTKEGLFAIRLPNSMREFTSGGPVRTAEGVEGTAAAWGRESAWIDYVGAIGRHRFGVTLMDAPTNPRRSRYHVRDYGLFAINPFGQAAYTQGSNEALSADPLELEPGTATHYRYGLYVHRGGVDDGNVREVFESFTGLPDVIAAATDQ